MICINQDVNYILESHTESNPNTISKFHKTVTLQNSSQTGSMKTDSKPF